MPVIGKVAKVTLALALPTSIILLYWLYKRQSSDEDVYGKQKILTSRNTTIEVSVPAHAAGTIIGRQGSRIKELQNKTGTRIQFKDRQKDENVPNTNRTVLIYGTAEAAQQAELMIYQIIADIPVILTEDIEVPHYTIGRIIGKQGTSIREINRISGAKIQISDIETAKNPDSPRIISIVGSRSQIDSCLELIQEKLEQEEEMRSKMAISASNRDQRKKTKEQKDLIKVTGVRKKEESWDAPQSGLIAQQDKLPLKSSFFEVYVSAVEHPGHFWVQVVGSKALQLEELQNDITMFAASDDAKLNFTVKDVIPGELVASRYEDEDSMYYRAKVLGEEQGKVDLYFVDFGDNALAEKKDIFKLRSDFCSFPFQAIECQLANVEPAGRAWTDEGITCFEDLVYCAQWKIIFAKVMTYVETRSGEKRPVVELIDTSGTKDVNIGEELVKQGYAVTADSVSLNPETAGLSQGEGSSDSANHLAGSSTLITRGAEGGSSLPNVNTGSSNATNYKRGQPVSTNHVVLNSDSSKRDADSLKMSSQESRNSNVQGRDL